MSRAQLDTPVAFFIFNRPDLTRQVFARIREAKPPRLFLVADGPRSPDEQTICDQTRAIAAEVDWPCDVMMNFAETNLGLRRRLASGISWVFENAGEAIFLEDDCLPHPSFFSFCADLLDRYRDVPRVMHISGDCFVQVDQPSSYYFTRYAHVWGWASWNRAWQLYDAQLDQWLDRSIRRRFLNTFPSKGERRFWHIVLDGVRDGSIDTWDYQWAFSVMINSGIAVNPARNLVSNLGFGPLATNTKTVHSPLAGIDSLPLEFPLKAPLDVSANRDIDAMVADLMFTYSWPGELKLKLRRCLGERIWAGLRNVRNQIVYRNVK